MKFNTDQENFWAGEFGDDYISRNIGLDALASNINFFVRSLKVAGKLNSCLEFGANAGVNLHALKLLFPNIELRAIEINKKAIAELSKFIPPTKIFDGSILDYEAKYQVEMSLVKGVLIHINPDLLPRVYEKLYQSTSRYILVAEYYNPTPVSIPYRGHQDRLFKRDFAGELLESYDDLKLIDYGFLYKGDPAFPQDDITWFLLEKK